MDCYWITDSIKDMKIEEFYDIGAEIGRSPFQIEGALSVVSACYDLKSKHAFAVNIIKKKVGVCPRPSEIGIFLKLNHVNVMKVKEVFETWTHVNVVREHIDGKPFFKSFKEHGVYCEHDVGKFVKQLVEGIRYLHEHNIVHGNLKSENILMKFVENDMHVKICDHIQSTIMNYDIYRLTILAMPSTCPPEILLSQIRTRAIDMWAVGICTFILLCGYEPFYYRKETEMFRSIIKGAFAFEEHCNVSTNASKDFINKCFVPVPEQRMNVIEAIRHPWLDISIMKNQPLQESYEGFCRAVSDYDTRLEEKNMYDIRRACEIFEKLILRNAFRRY